MKTKKLLLPLLALLASCSSTQTELEDINSLREAKIENAKSFVANRVWAYCLYI